MDIADRVVVVTGAAGGIGRAMATAFADAGARGVVVADVDGDGARRVAEALVGDGHGARAVRCDVSVESDVVATVAEAEAAFGPVDIFCANAGIVTPGGVELPDAAWEEIWGVNVLSHIYAARAVVPAMVARGDGYLLHTASAAGLLTQLGSAPYAVTKHAVVALAEWLSITYGDAGLTVSCLCPQGVWTAMTGAPAEGDTPSDGPLDRDLAVSTAGRDGMLLPADVARCVIEAVGDERFLILPHPIVAEYEQRRAGDRERWLRGMRNVQAQIAGTTG